MIRPRPSARGAFTLVELLIGMALSSMLMLAVLSSYVFLGRALTRLALQQELERQSRGTIARLTADISMAQSVTSANDTTLALTLPAGTVTYTYNSTTKTLTRTASFGASPTLVLLGSPASVALGSPAPGAIVCTVFAFNYFTTADRVLSPTDTKPTQWTDAPISIKQIEAGFTIAAGTSFVGTYTTLRTASGRFALRNRQLPTGS
jgi:prepilin-type N-terminal cleavage/methylation domain-containing protein